MKFCQFIGIVGVFGLVSSLPNGINIHQLIENELRQLAGLSNINIADIETFKELIEFLPQKYIIDRLEFNKETNHEVVIDNSELNLDMNDYEYLPGQELNKDHQITTGDFEFVTIESYSDTHTLRIKKHNVEELKLDTVEQYTGYLDVRDSDKHFFYWFFESRNDPKNDPLVIWLNGGPGCALDTGLLFELGPSFINTTGDVVFNPYSWNSNASVIFLDQPVGTGLSYGNDTVGTTNEAAKDFYIFLELFFKKFPEFRKNKFHIAGESYAGHYIPAFTTEIISHPERSFELESILIGNGYVDGFSQGLFDQEMLCSGESIEPILDEDECEVMNKALPYCAVSQFFCALTDGPLFCSSADYFCQIAYGSFPEKGLNPYDLRMKCSGNALCYDELDAIENYLNSDYVKTVLKVPNDLVFELCKSSVGGLFAKSRDELKPFTSNVAEILDYGIPVLFYAGDKDFVCHWIGYNQISNQVEFKDQDAYTNAEFAPWVSNGKEVGQVRGFGNFTFLRVYDSGHMVPHDQPKVSLEMLNSWLNGDHLF